MRIRSTLVPFRMFHSMTAIATKPHLVLFVDVNGTIIASDTERNKDRSTSIKHMLAEWKSVWDPSVTTKEMSYYDFVDDYLLTSKNSDERRQQRDEYFANFLTFLKDTNHILYDDAIATFEKVNAVLSAGNGEVFPSFTNMILELEQRKQPYSIIFRSFGTDTDFVLKEISDKTGIKFPQHLHFEKECLINGDSVIATSAGMLSIVEPGKHGKWADDFEHWDKSGRKYHAAKTYPLDSADLENTLTIFFDDNTLDKEIVNVCDKQDASRGHNEQKKTQEQMLKEGRLVHLETLDAILDKDHFIKYVDTALAFRKQWLSQQCDVSSKLSTKLT